jgi:hypothetical protein
MEPFKLELFRKEFPSGDFPSYDELGNSQIFPIFAKVASTMGTTLDESGYVDFVKGLFGSGKPYRIDAYDGSFDLIRFCRESHVPIIEEVIVIFYDYADLKGVRMKLLDLATHLEDIWYPPMEDLIVISSNYDWLITLGHWDAARVHGIQGASDTTQT